MATRDELLEELGLTPIFVRKNRPVNETIQREIPAAQISPPHLPRVVSASREEISEEMATKKAKSAPQVIEERRNEDISREARIAALDWDALVADISQCTACELCKSRTKTVPGAGARDASWLIVGEAPGEEEDKTGEAFVGRAGKLLDAMLKSVDRSREKNVYIANTLKCRPPENRNPTPEELRACAPYLKQQIALMKPKMILTFGKFAIQAITGSDEAVGATRGRTFAYEGIPVRVTYHPAYLLRSPGMKAQAWEDLLAAKKLFDKT